MARRQKSADRTRRPPASTTEWIYRLICTAAFVIPLTVSLDGRDSFRLPKELVFRAEMIALVALIVVGLILKDLDWKGMPWRHPAVLIAVAVVAWTLVSTLASTNRALSVPALTYACGAAVVFVATLQVARSRSLGMLRWIAWAGIINAALYLGVAFKLFSNPVPIAKHYSGIKSATGLLGNANDLGTALLPISIFATAAAISSKRHRVLFSVTAALAIAAVLVSVSVAAIGAMFVALGALALILDWKRGLAIPLVVAIAAGLLALSHAPLRYRVNYMVTAAKTAQWDELSSGRLTAFAAAMEMFEDHPFTGVGPGTFGWQFYPYKLAVIEGNPGFRPSSVANLFNFEEAHNDHLEILAETGAPGYAIFLASLIFVATGSLRRARTMSGVEDERSRFTRLLQLPLALGIGVVALAQYPLQLTSSLSTLIFIAAVCTAWRPDLGSVAEGGENSNA